MRFVGLLSSVMAVYAQGTLIQSVTAIDPGASAALAPVDVLIANGRIQAIGVIAQPENTVVFDGRGRFLIPGLWDMHVHLWNPENQPELYVAFGVTGVRDMGSDFTRTRQLRKSIESGERLGPHIVTSGAGVDGRASSDVRLPVIVAGSPEDGRRAADQIFDSGADFIKVFSSLGLETYLSLAERTRQLRIPFAGHLPEAVRIEAAIELRQSSIEHFFGLERAGELRLRKAFRLAVENGTRFTPTLTMHRRELVGVSRELNCLVLPAVKKDWGDPPSSPTPNDPVRYAHLEEMVRWLRDSSTSILAGTDTGDPFTVPGATLHQELKLLAAAGLSPTEVLRTATSEPVRFLGLQGSTGAIRRGLFGDLVLLDADPRERVENLGRIVGVWLKGRAIDSAQLRALRTCGRD